MLLDNRIESLWAIKTIGYSNEKKKKGEFAKDAYLAQLDFDTLGNVLKINKNNAEEWQFSSYREIAKKQAQVLIVWWVLTKLTLENVDCFMCQIPLICQISVFIPSQNC